MTSTLPALVQRELELRLKASSGDHAKYKDGPPVMRSTVSSGIFRCAVFSHVLGRTTEALEWFKRACEWANQDNQRGSIDNALLAIDDDEIRRIVEPAEAPYKDPLADLKWYLAKGDDRRAGEVASQLAASQKGVHDAAMGIVERDSGRLARGLDAVLASHLRHCPRGKSFFNGPHAFISHLACVLSALASRRGVEVRISEDYLPAEIPFLFIMIHDPLENPPSHIAVDLVPEVYRTVR